MNGSGLHAHEQCTPDLVLFGSSASTALSVSWTLEGFAVVDAMDGAKVVDPHVSPGFWGINPYGGKG